MKKFLLLALVLMLAAFAFTACACDEPEPPAPPVVVTPEPEPEPQPPVEEEDPAEEEEPEEPEPVEEEDGVPGILTGFLRDGEGSSSVDIIIGSGTDVWPYGAVPEDAERAFEPIPGATYRLTFNVTSDDAAGWRIRWKIDPYNYGSYTAADRAAANDFPVEQGEVGTVIPAVFRFEAQRGENFDLVVDVTLDPDEEYDGLIGNITLRGLYGSSEWFANWLTIELLEEGPGSDVAELIVRWDR